MIQRIASFLLTNVSIIVGLIGPKKNMVSKLWSINLFVRVFHVDKKGLRTWFEEYRTSTVFLSTSPSVFEILPCH